MQEGCSEHPSASQLSALAPLEQGFVSWIPSEKLTLDFGWFNSIYGFEVADEWQNPTFASGSLYFLQQPVNHLGLRVVVGGSPIDVDETPALGAQLELSLVDTFTLELGYLTGASGFNGNRAWGQFFDLILTGTIKRFTLILNANATLDPPVSDGQYSYGVALSGDMTVHKHFRVGARVEYLRGTVELPVGRDPDLLTVTAVMRYITDIFDLETSFLFLRTRDPEPKSDGTVPKQNDYQIVVSLGLTIH